MLKKISNFLKKCFVSCLTFISILFIIAISILPTIAAIILTGISFITFYISKVLYWINQKCIYLAGRIIEGFLSIIAYRKDKTSNYITD